MKHWLFLGIAIVAEVTATSALKASEGFSRLWPSAVVVLGYGVAFYFLSLTLRTVPVGVAYAIWSGLGVVLVALLSWWLFGQKLDLAAALQPALRLTQRQRQPKIVAAPAACRAPEAQRHAARTFRAAGAAPAPGASPRVMSMEI